MRDVTSYFIIEEPEASELFGSNVIFRNATQFSVLSSAPVTVTDCGISVVLRRFDVPEAEQELPFRTKGMDYF